VRISDRVLNPHSSGTTLAIPRVPGSSGDARVPPAYGTIRTRLAGSSALLWARGPRRIRAAAAALALTLFAPEPCAAASTKIWVSDSAADFSAGEARGVSVTVNGVLVLSRGLERVEGVAEAALFAAVEDGKGGVYLGTGDAGKVLRVTAAGKVETAATLPEKEVTALVLGQDGALYAGTSPGGKIYRVESGKAALHYESKAQYIWSLAFSGGTLYAGTGLPGEIHRVTAPGRGERVHATPDSHVRALHVDGRGRIWAGTSGSGLLLRLDPSGAASTVFDSAKTEITAIESSRDGTVWVAAASADAAPAGGEPITLPPGLPGSHGARPAAARSDEDGKDKPEVTVTVSAPRLAPPSRPGGRQGGYSSEVLLIGEDEPPRAVWTSSEELVFDLAAGGESPGVLAATGPNGKLYRVGPETWSLERTLDEKQLTVLSGDGIATNAASAFYRLVDGKRQGEYVSAVKDTGRTSRFGAFRWEGEVPRGASVEFTFRSGESGLPDTTWSPWSAWVRANEGARIDAPAGRYLQWKVRMTSEAGGSPLVRRVEAAYRNRNAGPVIESFLALAPSEVFARSAAGGSNVFETVAPDEKGIFTSLEEPKVEGAPRKLLRKGYRTLTWKATDPDGDPLTYELEVKPPGSGRWIPLRKGIRETFYSFDTTSLPDGEYVFRLTSAEAEANPEEKKSSARETPPVVIDNTPPALRRLSSSGAGVVEFEASDAASPLSEAEYTVDAKEWVKLEPKDGISDSMKETFAIRLPPGDRGGFLLVRVTDSSKNVAAAAF